MKAHASGGKAIAFEDRRFKQMFKEVLAETLEENRELISNLFAEAIEDVAIGRAIEEGRRTRKVSRESVIRVLEKSS